MSIPNIFAYSTYSCRNLSSLILYTRLTHSYINTCVLHSLEKVVVYQTNAFREWRSTFCLLDHAFLVFCRESIPKLRLYICYDTSLRDQNSASELQFLAFELLVVASRTIASHPIYPNIRARRKHAQLTIRKVVHNKYAYQTAYPSFFRQNNATSHRFQSQASNPHLLSSHNFRRYQKSQIDLSLNTSICA